MPDGRAITWRDAGLHSALLRTLNRLGDGLRRLGPSPPSLAPDALLAAARKSAGLADFGGDSHREALEVLSASLESEAGLTTFGRIALRGLVVGALANRLRVVDWATRHPEVREERLERPWIIVGLPRTGTTLLSILLGLDPTLRPLLSWEAWRPVPPPDLATHAEDPRIAQTARTYAQLEKLNPAVRALHPMGATLATECVTLLVFDLRSLSIETQAFLPGYGQWLEKCDMRSAYDLHRLSLQILQSRLPTGSWSLKTPNHLWCLDTLLETYPDARLVWTHRDPARVVPSVASLVTALQRVFSNRTDPVAVGAEWTRKLHVAVTRGVDFDRRHGDWCCHLHYADLMADPIAAVRRLYAHFGQEVQPLHARRMEAWMRDRPQDVAGRHVYDAADFELTPDGIRDRFADYSARYDVPRE